jgi:hypothetical protein
LDPKPMPKVDMSGPEFQPIPGPPTTTGTADKDGAE